MSSESASDIVPDSPFTLFNEWYKDPARLLLHEPTAVALSTSSLSGVPSVRMVLIKLISENGFVFCTNLGSNKAKDLKENPKASMLFYWKNRQIRVSGSVSLISDEQADLYFMNRPKESQLVSAASLQSQVINPKDEFNRRLKKLKLQFNDSSSMPRPSFWSGYSLVADSFEFWEAGENRQHMRVHYELLKGEWLKNYLYP